MKSSLWRKIAAAGILAAGFCFVLGIYEFGLHERDVSGRDFIEYWAAGQLLAHGANPYDLAATLRIERSAGLDDDVPRVTLSPPLILLLVLPLGYVGAKTGLIVWIFLMLSGLLASIWLLWRMQGSPLTGYHWISMAFAPVIACLMAGQISIFLLLALVLFLYWRLSRPLLAGAALFPLALKPHLFLPFAVALLLWVVGRKAYSILAGFAAALAAGCALATSLDRHAWSEYAQLTRSNHILHVFIPTLSGYFRSLIDPGAAWLLFVPAGAGCIWAVWYFRTRRARWDWMDQGLVVLLVSLLCAPYAFFYDETVLLPAVLAGVYCAAGTRRSLLPLALISIAALAETSAAVTIISRYYLWTTPAWLAWYLYARHSKSALQEEARSSEAVAG